MKNLVRIVMTCPFCGEEHCVTVVEKDYYDYARGVALAQEAFPYLSATEREQIISFICPDCQEKIFGQSGAP